MDRVRAAGNDTTSGEHIQEQKKTPPVTRGRHIHCYTDFLSNRQLRDSDVNIELTNHLAAGGNFPQLTVSTHVKWGNHRNGEVVGC